MAEIDDQKILAKYLDRLGLLWMHCPNEGRRSYRTANLLRACGLKRGVPDAIIFNPPPALPESSGCAIELKHGKNRASKEQEAWLQGLRDLGWQAKVCTLDVALEWLEELGYNEPNRD